MDQKRINGPESSFPYKNHAHVKVKLPENDIHTIFDKSGSRKNRQNDECRRIFLKSGVVSQAKGSGYIELGNTKVLVSVFDPREIPKQSHYCDQGELYCDFKFSPFACSKRKQPQTDTEERSLALSLKRALLPAVCRHEFPNFQVDVFANVLEDDGSVLAAAVSAASLALADAGIPMYDVLTASNVLIINDQILNDPTSAEEEIGKSPANQSLNHGTITMARLDILEQISELFFSGYVEQMLLIKACSTLIETNKKISQMMKKILSEKVNKRLKIVDKIERI